MSLKVIGNKVLVEMHVVEEQEIKQSGLIIETSKTVEKKHVEGTVVQLGQGEFPFKVGDVVLYGSHRGLDFEYEGTTYTLLKPEVDILAFYPEKKKSESSVELKGLDDDFLKKINSNS